MQRVSLTKTSRQWRPNREERPLQYVDIRGRWQNEAGGVEFFGEGPTYRFAEWGLMGQVGDGMATVSGRVVTLRGRNVLLGTCELSLVVNDSMLMGTITLMGIPVPYQLWRA
jgi:hypothetical protein